jgi:hypothetical protein
VGQGQAGDGDGEAFVDRKDSIGIVTADRQQAGARSLNVQALLDLKLVARPL